MSKTITIIRVAAILAIGFVAVFGIFCTPNDNLPLPAWAFTLLLTKIVGGFAAYVFYRLYETWRKTDAFFIKLDEWCADAE